MSENKNPTPPFFIPNGMKMLEYLKSDEGKERIREAREEYQKKHAADKKI